MNLNAIDTFLAIVETGSLIGASQKLNVTQSTITARLKALEEDLGQQLFVRYKAGAELTAAGLKFKHYADVMAGLWRQARQEAALPRDVSGLCNFGCHQDIWESVGKRFFFALKDEHPDLALSVWSGKHEELQRWLVSGVIDIALDYQPIVATACCSKKLYDEELILYSTREGSPIRFDPDYVYVDLGEDFGKDHAMSYADAGTARVSFGSAKWARDYVLRQGGSAYLPSRLAAQHVANGALYVLSDAPVFNRPVYLVIREGSESVWPWLFNLANKIASV